MASKDKTETKEYKLGHKFLGKTGVKVSEICLGAMTFGQKEKNAWGMPTSLEPESQAMLDHYVSVGGNFIDTANVYGESEVVIGNWITKRSKDNAHFRESLFIATKVHGLIGSGPNDRGCSRKHILDAVENSLKRLQTSYIDLYQCHSFDYRTSVRDVVSVFNTLIQQGKVRYFGVSNWRGTQMQEAMDIAQQYGWEPIVCQQPQYSLLCRSTEWDIIPTCIKHNIAVIPWSPLAGGWLAGRIKRDDKEASSGSRVAWAEGLKWKATDFSTNAGDERTWRVVDTLAEIAKDLNASSAQVALRWLMQMEGVTAPIIGAKTVKQLDDNLRAATIKLSDDQMARLTKASETPLPYPFDGQWAVARP